MNNVERESQRQTDWGQGSGKTLKHSDLNELSMSNLFPPDSGICAEEEAKRM